MHKPDLLVRKKVKDWIVDLNRSTLPSININEDYAKKLSPGGRDSKKLRAMQAKLFHLQDG